jgi:SOS-response transcriptional repressor LexA
MTIDPNGVIDSSATIGKDVELMMDMREQHSVTNAYNLNINPALFSFSLPPFWLIPTFLSLHHREETLYHSVAATKVITRHGILDSVLSVDKGSQVTARNLLYDAETGDVVLSSTKNEFNDPQYHFSWPSGWTYDGMSGAYKNIGVVLNGVNINQGRITSGINANDYFAAGDEILIGSKQKTGGDDCTPDIATFRAPAVLYTIDANVLTGGTPDIYFTDRDGAPFTGNDIAMKIIRSGRRNIAAGVGEVTLLANPLVKSGNNYALVFDTTKVISASATEFKQIWKVADKMKSRSFLSCVSQPYSDYAGQDQPNCGEPKVVYGNVEKTAAFGKDNCPDNFAPHFSTVYKVPANKYSSTVSQAAADAIAMKEIEDSGQIFANSYGHCYERFYSKELTKVFTKMSCNGDGRTGSSVSYTLPANYLYTWASQAITDSMAIDALNSLGQLNAEQKGMCAFWGKADSAYYVPNNCGHGGTAPAVLYKVAQGKNNSQISQAQADSLSHADVLNNGQAYANANVSCIYSNIDTSATVSRNNCGTGTPVPVIYSVPAGTFTSPISLLAANALAKQRIIDSAQTYANRVGVCTYKNVDTSATISRNTCGTGTTVPVVYSVPAGTFTSTVSQLAANALAKQRITDSAQTYANRVGVCTYKNVDTSATISRNTCGTGTTVPVIYSVPAGTFTSTVSQLAANALAKQRITDSAQTYANRVGVCTYKNVDTSATISRNNCGTGTTVAVTYSVAAGTFTSTVSQLAANALAKQRITDSAQTYANRVGVCTYKNIDTSTTISRNNCGTGTTVAVTYSVAAGTFTSTVSQLAANALAKQRITDSAQTYANRVGVCTYKNVDTSATVSRNDCGSPGTTTTAAVTYSVAAGTFTSTVSQLAANALAKQRIIDSAQTYANRVGICTYYNDSTGKKFLPVCATGYVAVDSVWYPVPAKKFSSTISKADANAKAQTDITTNGQTYANTNGTCRTTTLTLIVKGRTGANENTAHGGITIKTSAGVSIGSKAFDGTDFYGTTTYTTTAGSFTVTIAAMTACYASVNGGSTLNVYSAAQTVTVNGMTITVELWLP